MKRRVLSILMSVALLCSSFSFVAMADGNVAKVGSTEYATMDEALAAWGANSTLTLLADATLSDVVTLKSTEHHILDLSTFTLTAAEGKNAFEIVAYGTGASERYALTVKADATNPGGIDAGKKSIVFYDYSKGQTSGDDRPIIKLEGGIFTASTSSFGTGVGIYTKGTAARKAATVNISGGTFNCSINGATKSKLIISGGTFNYSVGSQGDSTATRTISGGKFKTFGFFTADDNYTKFVIGTAMNTFNRGCYVDAEGYLVIGGDPITAAGDAFEASTPYGTWNSNLKYSSAAANGLYWEDCYAAMAKKASGEVTVYIDSLDLKDNTAFKGTLLLPAVDSTLKITVGEGATPAWKVGTKLGGYIAAYTSSVEAGVETRTYFLVPVAVNNAQGGAIEVIAPIEAGKGALGAIAKDGYYFDGWTIATDAGSASESSATLAVDPAAIPTLITASFEAKVEEGAPAASFTAPDRLSGLEAGLEYSITVDGNSADYTADAEGNLALDEAWYGKSLSIVKKATDYQHTDSAAQIVAIPARYLVTYMVGELATEYYVLEGEKAPAYGKAAPTKEDYTFGGWVTDLENSTAYDFEAVVTADITLYAKFDPIVYEVEVETDTGKKENESKVVLSTENAVRGETVTLNAAPQEGYELTELVIFDEQGNQLALEQGDDGAFAFEMPKGDVRIEAQFKVLENYCDKEEECPIEEFEDVDAEEWYHDGVHYCIDKKLMQGVGEGEFIPEETATRAMIATVLWRMEGCPKVDAPLTFTDVDEDAWYAEAIRWAASEGILLGYGDGTVGAEDACTREQIATILYRYANREIALFAENELDYTDADQISAWAEEAVSCMDMIGVISGKPDKVLDPKGNATRAEMATMLQRFNRAK